MLQRGLPNHVDPVDVNSPDLMVSPALQEMHHAAGVARVHHPSLHGVLHQQSQSIKSKHSPICWIDTIRNYLADSQAPHIVRQLHGRQL